MKPGIPETIKLLRFAAKALIFSQTYQVKDFPRINALVSNAEGAVEVELNFSFGPHKIPCIKGKIKLVADLNCQRCLEKVSLHLQPDFKLAFLQNEQQSEEIGSDFETILNAEEEFSSIEFITDEILIAIPMIPMHDYNCASYQAAKPMYEQKRENPFAILKKLKQTNNTGVENGSPKK